MELKDLGKHARAAAAQQAVQQNTVSEAEFAKQLFAHGIKGYRRNYPQKSRGESWPAPIEKRNWSFDFVFTSRQYVRLGVWIHGQVHGQRGTGKVRGDGLLAPQKGPRTRDYEAANVLHALLCPLGWTIMTFSPQQIGSGVAVRSVLAWLSGDAEKVILELQS